ncbi:hypothetical protein Kpol_1059p26 [Vanderwaltozyma polyspora DSM 70294]|uniref:Zn(2)-C6 fungal-type domain-containing protein n=1 Tax=Vanderwaltozyma polyspora (strain ATCC 22028 / DSM 70294 / BCRC 21397 / CBS 2163 / NBRC 10782 / NRRL Y-8283 / UCD 57-17) TaxID=436907 RepID=A7TN30_VANPO|nr:uncharacterized protein Kpol_1059p26 [Vanderwaltozyma polyspora DSM 70294]EDO16336.1 hypothetical protein Kpol_1059p26 [Vanderwaltozyma polyspora DSM 70294]
MVESGKERRKSYKACVFCRRSHLVCNGQRPCERCIKRDISHLCNYEERGNSASVAENLNLRSSVISAGISEPTMMHISEFNANLNSNNNNNNNQNIIDKALSVQDAQYNYNKGSSFIAQEPAFASHNAGSEFSSLNEFLSLLQDPLFLDASNVNQESAGQPQIISQSIDQSMAANAVANTDQTNNGEPPFGEKPPGLVHRDGATTPKEHFFLTAADPSTDISIEERLKLVINTKLEAGLLRPYDYAKGYDKLHKYMDMYMNQSSKERILKPLSTIRPAFRAIAKSLKDVDLVLVEESFERMLLSYDRVFTSMSIPACLWRRTGEIFRANKEFASLVDCTVDDLRDGKLAIYELMTEESAVNFWEKYGSIAFDKGQKAVLTSCNLRTFDGRRKRPCCFSFTIRRDKYNIPICIVGNFIPIT